MRGAGAAAVAVVVLAIGVGGGGCDGEDKTAWPGEAPAESVQRAVRPPSGWRTVRNRRAGLTVAVPRRWLARARSGATLVRSEDELLVLTLAADRGVSGRETPAGEYARQTMRSLPGFRRRLRPRLGARIRRSPYETARVDATGTFRRNGRRQRVSVAVFRRPGRVTYGAIAFRNARLATPRHERALMRILSSLRGRPPNR